MPQGRQQQLFHQSNRITYILRAGNVIRPSTALPPIKLDDLHTEVKQMPQGHQQQLLQLLNRITYSLKAGKCHKAISNSSCNYESGSLTVWGQANAIRPSATTLPSIMQDPLQTEDRQIPQGHQQQLLHLSSRITYFLKAGKCHKTISNSSCIYQTGSLTSWGQTNATSPSAIALPPIKQNHLLAEGRQMPQGHQQQLLHLLSRITYFLRAGKCHKAIRNSSCTY